jgi:sulfite reductase (NADPH) flavoprotein alpha-component
VLALSGVVLSLEPVRERLSTPMPSAGALSVAAVAQTVTATYPAVDRIVRTASGSLIVHYARGKDAASVRVDPHNGQEIPAHTASPLAQFAVELHRSLMAEKAGVAEEAGRAAAGTTALIMVLLSVTGTLMLARSLGGWAAVFRPVRGSSTQRVHGSVARIVLLPLLLSAITGCYMSLATFGVVADGAATGQAALVSTPGRRLAVNRIAALVAIDVSELRELTFPRAQEPRGVYAIITSAGAGQIDATTGKLLAFTPNSAGRQVYELGYQLHTGQGLWPLAIISGLAALTVPLLVGAGLLIWWRRIRSRPRIRQNASPQTADTIILIGSEGNSTWVFAQALHAALTKAGHRVHASPMNEFSARYKRAKRMVILTATYGDGAPPTSANRFLQRLARGGKAHRGYPVAVVGFGDRGFPQFCRFADDVAKALHARGWPTLVPATRINRQSGQEFGRWAQHFGAAIGVPLDLGVIQAIPKTKTYALVSRIDYGGEIDAPTTVLRFAINAKPKRQPRFEVGDLIGIVPPGADAPRLYSLASSSSDGVLEICVRRQPGGLCSTFLYDLRIGATINAFVRPNPAFRPMRGKAPLILIGAGTGIGPLAGIIRQNAKHRPIHLYWGGRHPGSDYLYQRELDHYLADKRLKRRRTAFSRVEGGFYVQDRLAAEANVIRDLVERGGQVMVCGGREMASDVAYVVSGAIKPLGIDLKQLKSEGRYLEDVY